MSERVLTPIERDCPAGWTASGVRYLDTSKDVPFLVAWHIDRDDCGCQMRLGIRTDNGEITYGMGACDAHRTVVEQTLLKLRLMKGQPKQIHQLAGEIFEAKLARTA